VKKILFAAVCGALLASCASNGTVAASAITEAKTLQALAKADNWVVPASADSLITAAEKQNDENQTSQAFLLADEAILQLRLSMLKQEHEALAAENKKAADSLATAKEHLSVYSNVLKERINAPKEQVIQ